jgi:hypothetical protein
VERPAYEQRLAGLRQDPGGDAFEAAWREGQALSLDQVMLEAGG